MLHPHVDLLRDDASVHLQKRARGGWGSQNLRLLRQQLHGFRLGQPGVSALANQGRVTIPQSGGCCPSLVHCTKIEYIPYGLFIRFVVRADAQIVWPSIILHLFN